MKYYILAKEKNPSYIIGKHTYEYIYHFDHFNEVENFINKRNDPNSNIYVGEQEFMVIKGIELPFDIETEEIIHKTTVIKSKKIKDV